MPCGECNACCRSFYFIHIRPEETQTLARIPRELLFAAPGLPEGHVLLGYDENGHCPMLIDNKCSIYAYRPLTCRTYDCRIFPAAGLAAGDDDKALITQQIRRWQFSFPTKLDHNQQAAVQAAARFLRQRAECFPAGVIPSNSTQLAILALKVYDVFLKYGDESGKTGRVPPDLEVVKAIMEANEKLEAGRDTPSKSSPRLAKPRAVQPKT
ncbi:MAG: YkgJ family cysteine cluster protein [Deltaproteobacteria bacterium]|nr:YkgJ family cysteine cluster protein [Deltaproteobacteria bacterium]